MKLDFTHMPRCVSLGHSRESFMCYPERGGFGGVGGVRFWGLVSSEKNIVASCSLFLTP
jgi:hypothetical protein